MTIIQSLRKFTCWAAFSVSATAALAQNTHGSIAGSVQSADKQQLGKASVTVVHVPTGAKRAAVTDDNGQFALADLTAGGPYVVQVSQPGFQPRMADNVFLPADKPVHLSFVLNRPGAQPRPAVPTPAASKQVPRVDEQPKAAPAPTALTVSTEVTPAAPPAPAAAAPAPAAPAGTAARTPGEPPRTYRYTYSARKPAPVVKPATPGHYDAKTGNYIYETGAPTTLKLPGGGQISGVGQQSTESLLYRFIIDGSAYVDTVDLTKGWLNFDRVFFEPGKATLTPDSKVQLGHIAQLLRAYPNVRIKIGGYTDSTGAYKVNRLLSEARAQAAWAALVEMGVGASRMDARGYGPRYAIAPNLTEEGRAQNRRLSIKVLQK